MTPVVNVPRAYSVRDAAARLSVSRVTLYRLAAANKVRFIRVGGRTLVPGSELLRIAEQGTGVRINLTQARDKTMRVIKSRRATRLKVQANG